MSDDQQDSGVQENNEVNTVDVRRRALQALAPLLTGLDATPERKFEISMTAIRATEDKSLTAAALDAALAIEDDNLKAESLLELVNEIDYLEKS